MTYIIKNNIIDRIGGEKNVAIVKDCICNCISTVGINIVDSTLYRTSLNSDYIAGNIYARNCVFKGTEGQNEMKFSFNLLNAKRV